MTKKIIESESKKQFHSLAVIGRFKPLHNGAALMLDALCDQAEEVKIGIGSSNKYNQRNPFTAEETEEMLRSYLSPRHDNFEIIYVPDFAQIPQYADGQEWRTYVREHFGTLDGFVSGNDYVRNLLKEDYLMIHPAALIPQERWVKIRASEVRLEIVQGKEHWKDLIPSEVVVYLEKNNLIERFKQEFGEEILRSVGKLDDYRRTETEDEERSHTREK